MDVLAGNSGLALGQPHTQSNSDDNQGLSCRTSAQNESSLRKRYAEEVREEVSSEQLNAWKSQRTEAQWSRAKGVQDVKLCIKCLEDGKVSLEFAQGFIAAGAKERSTRISSVVFQKEEGVYRPIEESNPVVGAHLGEFDNPEGFKITYRNPFVGSFVARVDAQGEC